MDTRKRSIAKAVVWRVVGVIVLGVIVFWKTGDVGKTALITILFHVITTGIYYVHERIWIRILWGKRVHPLSGIRLEEKLPPEQIEVVKQRLKDLGYTVD